MLGKNIENGNIKNSRQKAGKWGKKDKNVKEKHLLNSEKYKEKISLNSKI